ncbi:MAG: phosphatidylserine decarboxylase family protein [Bacteroidales bacterium]|nr:phosphatidylserine decarboxylase family protein [Bacteroidales bacterium]
MNWIKIDSDSYGTILISWCICAVLIFLVAYFIKKLWISIPLCSLFVIFMVFITWFFRVPNRDAPDAQNDRLVTSVADGKVVIVEKVFEKEYLKKECIQISVYMDFFDVHCNFWPINGEVSYYRYHPGKYLLAFHPKSSELNEHSSSCLKNDYGEVFFKQIAGTFARRIVCYSEPGKKENRGDQCGVIKFGSRIDHFVPLDADVKVKVGDKVTAVESVIAVLPDKKED